MNLLQLTIITLTLCKTGFDWFSSPDELASLVSIGVSYYFNAEQEKTTNDKLITNKLIQLKAFHSISRLLLQQETS